MGRTRTRATYRLDTWPLPPAPRAKPADGDGHSGELPGTLATLAAGLVGIAAGMMALMVALAVVFVIA